MAKARTTIPTVAEVRDSVLEHVRSAGINPGERLPTERELHRLLGVSRNRIRDALAALESLGVVRRRVGSGTWLETSDEADWSANSLHAAKGHPAAEETTLNVLSPYHLIEARIIFEVSLAPAAVRNATDNDLQRMEDVLLQSESAQTEDEFERLDTEFHHLIAVATHNIVLIQFSETISRGRQAAGWRRLKRQSATPERRTGYQSDHRKILLALQERSADALAAILRKHLTAIQSVVLKI